MQVNTSSGTGLVTQAQALTLPVSPQQLGEERGHVGTGLQGDAMMEALPKPMVGNCVCPF